MKKILVFALSCALLASCSTPSKDTIDESLVVPDSLKASNTSPAPVAPVQQQPMNGLNNLPQNQQPVVITPQQQQVQPNTAPPVISSSLVAPNATNATATATPAGMNPPHGQPGHRCDIAVGAPLNSKPTPTTPVTATAKPGTTTITPVNVPVTPTAPGMNPPHGQPGHRCEIAVGAPLNSAPAATPVAVPVTPVNTPAAVADTAKGGATGARGGK